MNIYLICPVRHATTAQRTAAEAHIRCLEYAGHDVFWPHRDAPQNCETGCRIVAAELEAMQAADMVYVMWDRESKGSHFDLGMAYALRKPIKRVLAFRGDKEGKSYWKVMGEWEGSDGME